MKKTILFHIYQILKTFSDEEHPLTRREIQKLLETQYDIQIERHTFTSYIDALIEAGVDIQSRDDNSNGTALRFFLGERSFEKSEIHLLCNAIYSSHFIPETESKQLIQKLLHTQSKYVYQSFYPNIYLKNSNKSLNHDFFLNIEVILEAVQQNKAISFDYMKYDYNKKMIPRKDKKYIVHPYHIVYANENYYLLCQKDDYTNLSHYRIDKMKNIIITALPIRPTEKNFNPYEYCKTKIYMYGGNVETFTILCDHFILDDMIDRFGQDIYIQKKNDKEFLAIIKSSKQGMLYFALQYMNYCTIIEPADVREEFIDILKCNLKKYASK